MFIKSMDYRSL